MSAQPSQNDAYSTQGNPASKEPAEKSQSKANAKDDSGAVYVPTYEPIPKIILLIFVSSDQRIPSKQTTSSDEATPSAMGQGVRGGTGTGEDASKLTDQEMGRSGDVDAEQMGAPGEGKVADAVKGQSAGSGGTEPGQETDLDRKKAQQAPQREAMQQQEKKDVDVQGVLGQRSAPADPTT